MDAQATVNLIGTVFYVALCVIGTASVVAHARVPWRKSRMGIHLMIYMGSFALTLDLGLVKLLVGDSLGFQVLRLAAFALLPFALGQRLYLQIQAQLGSRDHATPPAPSATSVGGPGSDTSPDPE